LNPAIIAERRVTKCQTAGAAPITNFSATWCLIDQMKILEALKRDAIIADLKSQDKKGVLEELATPVARSAGIDIDKIVRVLRERERLGSTGIGGGIGIPHGKLKELQNLVLGFGISRRGIDFESMDNRPTHIFFLLVTPENSTGLHLKVLARISRILKNDPFKERLLEATDVDEIYGIIAEEDEDF
jgi:PTS system nitrogen regulatory IIA component